MFGYFQEQKLLSLPAYIHYTRLEMPARAKHSSLLAHS
jgi:hypothetical protein